MASDIWLRTILIVRKETHCRHIGYSFRLTARFFLYAPPHRQDSTYHGLCYTSREALAGTRNSSMGSPHEVSIRRPIAPWAIALTTELHLAPGSFMCTILRQASIYHSRCYTNCRTLAGIRNNLMSPLSEINPTIHWTSSRHPTIELHPNPC